MEQNQITRERKPVYSIVQASIWGGLLLFGLILKLMSWPGLLIIIVTSGGMTGFNIVMWLMLNRQHVLNNILLGAGAIWILILIAGVAFNDGIPVNINGMMVHALTILIVAGINYLAYRKFLGNAD